MQTAFWNKGTRTLTGKGAGGTRKNREKASVAGTEEPLGERPERQTMVRGLGFLLNAMGSH